MAEWPVVIVARHSVAGPAQYCYRIAAGPDDGREFASLIELSNYARDETPDGLYLQSERMASRSTDSGAAG